MTAEKAEIRATALHEVGVALDDRLEATKREQQQLAGQKAAFGLGAKLVQQLMPAVDAEVADGKLDLVQAELAKRWIARAGGVLQNLALRADSALLTGQGRVEALTAAVEDLRRRHEAEAGKAARPQEAPGARQEGQHPGPALKEARTAEASPETAQAPQAAVAPAKPRKRKKVTRARHA